MKQCAQSRNQDCSYTFSWDSAHTENNMVGDRIDETADAVLHFKINTFINIWKVVELPTPLPFKFHIFMHAQPNFQVS